MATIIKTFDDVLIKIRRESTSAADLGAKFENIMLSVFREDKLYKDRFDKVWMWRQWARENDIKEKLGTEHDLGVDLVARERVGGKLCAIQCKCHSDDNVLDMGPVDKLLSAGRVYGMKNFILACTGPINRNALAKLRGVKCGIITKEDLRYRLDWSKYPKTLTPSPPKKLRDYQRAAYDDVVSKFQDNAKACNRGKLIMACGTGKTLVALHIAERLAGRGGLVLYLVPSISLILQSMREWSENANMRHYYMAVCSDKSVRNTEQGTMTELEAPASTDTQDLAENLGHLQDGAMNVIFSTYQSIDVVVESTKQMKFDIVFCDEAHRTTGVEKGSTESTYYTKIHHEHHIRARRRLYMTATPRIYTENVKGKAENQQKTIISMDDQSIYGPELHNLTFYDAVHKYDALCDFKVRVAIMDEDTMDRLVQQTQSGEENAVPVNEKSLMASVWHAIQHPSADDSKALLQRVIFFCDMINSSKIIAGEEIQYNVDYKEEPEALAKAKRVDAERSFEKLVAHINNVFSQSNSTSTANKNSVDVKHVDGADNAQDRKNRLEWLKNSDNDPHTCRILSNARCLSEGVDVPALDGVVFLNPRKSVVDVVQAVGRVMRKSENKEYGYVILPVVIPMGVSIDEALSDSKYFRVVWQVLNALRSHDRKLENEINKLTLEHVGSNNEVTNRIIIRHAYSHDLNDTDMPESRMIDAISSKLVRKVGDIAYYDKYAERLGVKARGIKEQIINRMGQPRVQNAVHHLQDGLHSLINDSITSDDTISVIAQHMVLSRIFDMLFRDEFASHNPVSETLSDVVEKLHLTEELREFEEFYEEAEVEIRGISTTEARQNFIRKIYENFFKGYAKKETEHLGIVYTPIEIIDFILNSVQHILQTEFGTDFVDRNVKVLDPFAGIGTFLSRLLESGMLGSNIRTRYKYDLFANEILLLAYYVATVNIETTYSRLGGGEHVPFDGISYTDTLQTNPRWREDVRHRQEVSKLDKVFAHAQQRMRRQRGTHLHVIIGNPPYSIGQKNASDNNPNTKYPEIDKRIQNTYKTKTETVRVTQLYDSYVRSIRWATDRIGRSGIIGFVTNSSFLRSEGTKGIRAYFQEEFTDVWVFDLRGNQRTQGEISKKEGGKIFGSGSRAPVAITILVKNSKKTTPGTIHYHDIGDYHGRGKKLEIIKTAGSLKGITSWKTITPDNHHDWLELRSNNFSKYLPMGSKAAKAGKNSSAIFRIFSLGVSTNRDEWVYNSSKNTLVKNMNIHIDYANSQKDPISPVIDKTKAKFTRGLKNKLKKQKPLFDYKKIRISIYRPFFKQYLYFDDSRFYNEDVHLIPKFFPKNNSENLTIAIPDKGTGEKFSTIITNKTPDLHVIAQSQVFPFKTKMLHSRERERERGREGERESKRNLCIIVPYKIQGKFSALITDTTPDLEVIHHGQVFPLKVME